MRIKINKKAPVFKLDSTSSKPFELSKIKGGLIIYFYPKDNTPGCTTESIEFQNLLKEFAKLNTEVIGISRDSLSSHEKFRSKYDFSFNLISDED